MKLSNRLRQKLIDNGIDAIVLFDKSGNDSNMFYMTGLHIEYSFLVILNSGKSGKYIYYVPEFEYTRAKLHSKIKTIKVLKDLSFLKEISKNKASKVIGLDLSSISVNSYNKLKKHMKSSKTALRFKDISNIFFELRTIKLADEIELIKKSYLIASNILKKCIRQIISGNLRSEKKIFEFLQIACAKENVTFAFDPIVASGKNAALPHHTSLGKLNKGFLVLDFGVRYKGYCSDITRTIYIGKPSKHEIETYEKIRKYQQNAIDMIKLGKRFADIDAMVRDALGPLFNHSLGHGVGIDEHELPNVGPNSVHRVKSGMVFTVEPGIYDRKNGFGIRIEDGILFDKKTYVLSRLSKRLIYTGK